MRARSTLGEFLAKSPVFRLRTHRLQHHCVPSKLIDILLAAYPSDTEKRGLRGPENRTNSCPWLDVRSDEARWFIFWVED